MWTNRKNGRLPVNENRRAIRSAESAHRDGTRVLTALALLLVGVLTTGCAGLLAENDLPAEISVRNDTDQTLEVVYRGRELRVMPPHSHAYLLPRPTDGDHCLIAPMLVTDRGGEIVARVEEGRCYGERPINLTVEQQDLSER